MPLTPALSPEYRGEGERYLCSVSTLTLTASAISPCLTRSMISLTSARRASVVSTRG